MLKKQLTLFLFLGVLGAHSVYAQLAKQEDISTVEIMTELYTLLQSEDQDAKTQLSKEVLALEKSEQEDFVILAVWLYKQLGQNDKAESLESSLAKRFPKGVTARSEAHKAIFSEADQAVGKVEKAYKRWLRKFPADTYEANQRSIYNQAKAQMAIRYFGSGDVSRANAYVEALASSDNFPYYAHVISSYLLRDGAYETAAPLLERGFIQAQSSFASADSSRDKKLSRKNYVALAPQYAEALIQTSNPGKAVDVLEDFFDAFPGARSRPEAIQLLAEGYSAQGLDLEAFLILNTYLSENGINDGILEVIKPLYTKLNSGQGDFQDYLAGVKLKANAALIANYKDKMIKKKAPLFSLVNRAGETVDLADLKGKVVVLDFWATWCGPCKMSFPGMQAAVNKYEADPEVEFLFINTWQREANYKELVNQFIQENDYTFNVLFDEMKDMDKATTTSYGVRGIPHKVVIDKAGYIRFESSGGSADVDKVLGQMETMIELARKG